eukprot:gene1283-1557_t
MAVLLLWSVGDAGDGEDAGEDALFQPSQGSGQGLSTGRGVEIDYLGESLQCELAVDRYFGPAAGAGEVYSALDRHLLGVLRGQPATCLVRLGPRPPQRPLGVLFGDLDPTTVVPLVPPCVVGEGRDHGSSVADPEPQRTDGIAVRVVKRLFEEMQVAVRGGGDAFSVKMGLACFMNTPAKPTDLLKNIRQQVPAELEWGAAEGVLHTEDAPGRYIYATAAGDVLRTLAKLVHSESFRPLAHRLSPQGGGRYRLSQSWPRTGEALLKEHPKLLAFCFADDSDDGHNAVAGNASRFTFTLTDRKGRWLYGCCVRPDRGNDCLCILSRQPWFGLWFELLGYATLQLMQNQRPSV